ncbi:sensor histidine kinase [Alicyclobacillus hesperidum]|uniref:sensor histidine kinase n=1 Tax=Alicyclobacillus hesperidum TaxID=89784 RepID=UPI0009DA83F9|nr:ATP-binding protein [Alicyclobacillus hesperidum]
MFRRLSLRLTMLSVVLLVVLYTITSVAVYTTIRSFVMRSVDFGLREAAYRVMNTAVLTGIPSFGSTGSPQIYFLLVENGSFSTIPDASLAAHVKARLDTVKNDQEFLNYTFAGEHYRIFYVQLPTSGGGSAYLATLLDDSQTVHVLSELQSVIILVGAFGMLGAALVGFILSDRMLQPIRRAWQRQLEFVADASHELRTPLAVIQSNLGIVMEHTDQSVEENLEWLNNAHGEARRLAKLVQDLLTLARSDSERMPIDRKPLDLRDLLLHIQDLYETIADMKGIHLTVRANEPLVILGDRDRLHQLLVILLDNAVKFTDEGGEIELAATRSRNHVTLSVRDTGLGIAKEHLDRVFDRFFTVDPSRSREQSSKGTGLGLSIARWVAEAHGGRIGIWSDGLGKGTTVRVELPFHPKRTTALSVGDPQEPSNNGRKRPV